MQTMTKPQSGALKIFFGYAAGVGKTYSMLEAAQQLQKEGVDVVVGYVEPHARPDTLALLENLERLPTREMNQRGIILQEFDLDAALARKPAVILVDELAHTNACGSRHMKRYQDVEELLNAGIDVYTTVNVQHLESLNDVVEAMTGIAVSERIPDEIFDRANQVTLIDIEPQALMKRLEEGKVYRTRQAKRALSNFFTLDNLTALREIAMRRTADQLTHVASEEGIEKGVRAGEHILICLSAAPSNAKVIRTAARMAEAFHSAFTALYIQTPESELADEAMRKALRANMRLAEQLGAQISVINGTDPAVQIAEYARISGVTKIVMGRMNHLPRVFFGKKSLADRLIECTELDVYIIPDKQPRYRKPRVKKRRLDVHFSWRDTLMTLSALLVATLVGLGFYHCGISEANIISMYMLAVLLVAVTTEGYLYGVVTGVASIFTFNFFFTVPRFSFEAYDPSYPVTFAIMFVSSMLASSMASRVKVQARQMAQKSYYTELLLRNSQRLQTGRNEWECLTLTAEQLHRLFDRPILYAVSEAEEALDFRVMPSDEGVWLEDLSHEEMAVAKWVQRNNKHAGATTNTLPNSRWLFLSVRGNSGVMGIVGIPMEGAEAPDGFEKNLMLAMLGECGITQERIRVQEARLQQYNSREN
jgi:two-component system sensor histidine kinase KdpD